MSPVNRGWPWNATACPPTTTYSTPREFNNSTNSRKSLCSFTDGLLMRRDQLEQHIDTLVGRQRRVVRRIRGLGLVERAEALDLALHPASVPRRAGAHGIRSPPGPRRCRPARDQRAQYAGNDAGSPAATYGDGVRPNGWSAKNCATAGAASRGIVWPLPWSQTAV
jgi:hypothetical protein